MTTLEKLKKFYADEIKGVERALDPSNSYKWNKKEVINNAIQRGLGVSFFAQAFDDVTYNEINKEYEAFRNILYDMLKNSGE